MEECCGKVLQRGVVEKCCREVWQGAKRRCGTEVLYRTGVVDKCPPIIFRCCPEVFYTSVMGGLKKCRTEVL